MPDTMILARHALFVQPVHTAPTAQKHYVITVIIPLQLAPHNVQNVPVMELHLNVVQQPKTPV